MKSISYSFIAERSPQSDELPPPGPSHPHIPRTSQSPSLRWSSGSCVPVTPSCIRSPVQDPTSCSTEPSGTHTQNPSQPADPSPIRRPRPVWRAPPPDHRALKWRHSPNHPYIPPKIACAPLWRKADLSYKHPSPQPPLPCRRLWHNDCLCLNALRSRDRNSQDIVRSSIETDLLPIPSSVQRSQYLHRHGEPVPPTPPDPFRRQQALPGRPTLPAASRSP